jgi:hypothetical protein
MRSCIINSGYRSKRIVLTKHRTYMLYVRKAFFLVGKPGEKSSFWKVRNRTGDNKGARGSIVVKAALCYKPEGRGFDTR